MVRVVVGALKNGELVIDRRESHIHPELQEDSQLLRQALTMISVPKESLKSTENITFEVVFPEVVGKTDCIRCLHGDRYAWAVPLDRTNYRRYILNRTSQDCNRVVVTLAWVDELTVYELRSAYIGFSPAYYLSDSALSVYNRKRAFWRKHALVFPGMDKVDQHSYTEVRPESWEYVPLD